MLVRGRWHARRLTGPELWVAAFTGAEVAFDGVRLAFLGRSCHCCSEEQTEGRRSRGGRIKKKGRRGGHRFWNYSNIWICSVSISANSTTFHMVNHPTVYLPPLLAASSSSHMLFTTTVAWPTGEGRPNTTRRRPGIDGGRCPVLRPGEPTGTPLGPNQHARADLALMLREGL